MKTALRWGFYVGLANLVWLYLAYYLGLHTSGVMVFQVFMLVWFVLTLAGFILGLRAVKRATPGLTYLSGLGAGVMMSVISAIMAVVAQVGYFKIINPAWPETMAHQSRDHFTKLNIPPEKVDHMVEQARAYFTLSNYATSSMVTALVLGAVLSAIIMIFLLRRPTTPQPS